MPRQGGIADSMNRFLSQYLPMLYQQRSREGYVDYSQKAYLDRFIQQLEAREGFEVSASDRARVGNMLQNFFATAGAETKELPYGSQQFAERTGATAREFGLKPLPVDPELGDKTQLYSRMARELVTAKLTGQEPSSEVLEFSVAEFGLDAVVSEVAKFDEAMAKRIDQRHRGEEIGIKLTAAETGKTTAQTAAAKQADVQRTEWMDFVTDIEDHLRQEGVKGGTLSDRMKGVFGSGKLVDPLSPENRGAAYTYLGEIRAKLIQRQKLTSGEIRFLTTVRSTAKIERPIEEGGGLTDPSVTDLELETREATIRAYMDFAKETTGITDEVELRKLAMEFLRILK